MAPVIPPALGWASLGVSALSGISNLLSGNKNIDKQIKAQQEENRKNREYNLMLAQQQNQWNQDQWERENEYNTPVNQIKRMKDANLNPDMAYGNGAAQSIAASSPPMTSGASSNPADMSPLGQKMTLGQAIQQTLQSDMIQAQIDNIRADSEKKRKETYGQQLSNEFTELANQLDLDAKVLANNLSAQQQEFAIEQFNLLKQQIQTEKAKLLSMDLDNVRKKIENSFKDKELSAIVKKLENDAKISEQDAKFALESFTYRLLDIQSQGLQSESNSSFIKWMNDSGNENLGIILKGIRFILDALGK